MEEQNTLAARLQTMRIIHGALMMGLASFLVVVLVAPIGGERNPDSPPFISFVALGYLLLFGPLSFVLPPLLAKKYLAAHLKLGKTTISTDELAGGFQSQLIVGLALLEGAGFLGCIAYMVEKQAFVLAVPVIVLILMAIRFPSGDGLTSWMERNRTEFDDMKARGDGF